MPTTPDISESLNELRGKKAWGLRRSDGSVFLFDIGNPIPSVSRRMRGEWGFLFESCDWSFQRSSNQESVSSDDDRELIESAFDSMQLGDIHDADFLASTGVLSLRFSSGLRLTVSPQETEEDVEATEWLLFTPGDMVWAKTRSALTFGSSHKP